MSTPLLSLKKVNYEYGSQQKYGQKEDLNHRESKEMPDKVSSVGQSESIGLTNYNLEQGVVAGLTDINLHVHPGESIGLIGENGAGKSTLMKLIVGLCQGYSGEILVEGVEVTQKMLPEVRQKIGYVFQDSDNQLFMNTVFEDVAFGPRNYGYTENEVVRRVNEALEAVKITHLRDKSIYRLSGGEKKLVSIATILALDPKLILMDEPSVALDPRNRRNLINILNKLPQVKLIASHDLDFILDTCERTVLLSAGKIVIDGPTSQVLANKELLESHGLELPLSMSRNS